MSLTNLEIVRGDQADYRIGPVTVTDQGVTTNVDLTAGGTSLWFTAKTSVDDTDLAAVIRKGSPSTSLSGIVLNSPVTTAKNVATLTIAGADTAGLDDFTVLVYDIQLVEPSGRKTTIQRGTLTVVADVTLA